MDFSLFDNSNHPLHPRIISGGTIGIIYLETALEKEEIKTKKKITHNKKSDTAFFSKSLFSLKSHNLIEIPIKIKTKMDSVPDKTDRTALLAAIAEAIVDHIKANAQTVPSGETII